MEMATEYSLNPKQALFIAQLSETPVAAEVRNGLIELFFAYREGKLAPTNQATLSDRRRLQIALETIESILTGPGWKKPNSGGY
jgi:hypothetical protein